MVPCNVFITVHDSAQVRDSPNFLYDFATNGLAVLAPVTCKVTEELNGGYYCEMMHPIDQYGKWKHLNENNILSVPIRSRIGDQRQLFRIAVREVRDTANGKQVYVLAHHIFYDLRGRVVAEPNITAETATYAIRDLMYSAFTRNGEIGKTWYPYAYSSDIEEPAAYAWSMPKTLVDLLLVDDHSIVNIYGGEIFRDNFNFSVNRRKEGSIDHAAPIRYSVDMLEVTERTDFSQYCNYARAYIDDGNWIDIAYDSFGSAPGDIVRMQQFHYQNPTMEKLEADMNRLFYSTAKPITTFSVKYREIANNPDYSDFYATKSYEVGDTVPIINERIGIDTVQKMVKRVFNVLTQSTESAEFDSIAASFLRKAKLSDTAFASGEDVEYLRATRVGKKYGEDQGEVFNDLANNVASGKYSTARGTYCTASGANADAGGNNCQAKGENARAWGLDCRATAKNATAGGQGCQATANAAVSLGMYSKANGSVSTALGYNCTASGSTSLACGYQCQAWEEGAVALGRECYSKVKYTFTSGYNCTASGYGSVSMGDGCNSSAASAFSFGRNSTAGGIASVTIGTNCTVDAESVTASGGSILTDHAMAIGENCTAKYSHALAMGRNCTANAYWAYTMGLSCVNNRTRSLCVGNGLVLDENSGGIHGGAVFGSYNKTKDAAFCIGDGDDENTRKDLFLIDAAGNVHITGDIYIKGSKVEFS